MSSPLVVILASTRASCARDANNASCKRQELGTSRCETTEDGRCCCCFFSFTTTKLLLVDQPESTSKWRRLEFLSSSPARHTAIPTKLLLFCKEMMMTRNEDGNYGMGLIGAAKTSFEALGKTST